MSKKIRMVQFTQDESERRMLLMVPRMMKVVKKHWGKEDFAVFIMEALIDASSPEERESILASCGAMAALGRYCYQDKAHAFICDALVKQMAQEVKA